MEKVGLNITPKEFKQLSKWSENIYNTAVVIDYFVSNQPEMLMYGKEASNRKQQIDRQHYTIPNQRPKDKHCGKI